MSNTLPIGEVPAKQGEKVERAGEKRSVKKVFQALQHSSLFRRRTIGRCWPSHKLSTFAARFQGKADDKSNG
jgi:hypothetical protein